MKTRYLTMRIAKIVSPVVGVLLFAAPAFAQTSDDYGIAAAGTYCPSLSITMQRGARDTSTNGQVSELQKFLADYYDIDPTELVTRYFGRITQGYVIQFQKEQGLPTFGIAGSLTRSAIAKVCTSNTFSGHGQSPQNSTQTTPSAYIPPTNTQPTSPSAAPQASSAPTCTLAVTTTRGTHTISNTLPVSGSGQSERIMMWNDEPLTLKWNSPNALQAFDYSGQTVSVTGSAVIQPPQVNRSYQYQFNNYNGNTYCTAVVYPVSGGIEQSSLNSSLANPTISGFATGVSSVEVVVRKDTFTTARLYDNTSVPVVNGRWSSTISPALATGTYIIDVYGPGDMKLNYIVSGILTLNISATPPSATIDQASLAPSSGSFVLSGSASGSSRVDVYVVPASYSGGTDLQSLGNLEKGGGTPGVSSNTSYVSNGRWSTSFSGFVSGAYKIYVLDYSSCTISSCGAAPLLGSASLSIPAQQPTCTLSATNPYDSSGTKIPVTLSWTSQNATNATMQYRWIQNLTWTAMNNVSANGSMVVNPTDSTYYSLIFSGSGGSKECIVTVGLKG